VKRLGSDLTALRLGERPPRAGRIFIREELAGDTRAASRALVRHASLPFVRRERGGRTTIRASDDLPERSRARRQRPHRQSPVGARRVVTRAGGGGLAHWRCPTLLAS